MKDRFILLVSLIFLSIPFAGVGQIYPLDKKVTLNIQNQPVEKVLAAMSSSAGVNFSYNSDIVPLDSVISVRCEQREIQKVLNQIFPNKYNYKTKGNYIIIQNKKTSPLPADSRNTKVMVTGSVKDSESGKAIANTSVFSINGKDDVLTDSTGNFTISISPKTEDLFIAVHNADFEDTLIFLPFSNSDSLLIKLKPKSIIDSIQGTLRQINFKAYTDKIRFPSLFLKKDLITHANNIDYFTERTFQLSLLPFAGTNYRLSGSISNKISLNLVSGYSYGVNGCEIGGFLNINRKFVKGVQLGGFGNITGGKTSGVQVAGFFNQNFEKTSGLQIAGFYNMVTDTLDGVQLSGFANFTGDTSSGAQVSGFSNISAGTFSGIQISGYTNITVQDTKGAQVSGFANITGETMHGIQIAGFLNYAKKVEGSQIGFINIADSVSGVSFGFLNLILNGLHQISFHVSETGCSSLRLSLGTHHFYTTMGLSILPVSGSLIPGYEYGIGTYLWHKKRINVNFDLGSAIFIQPESDQKNNFLLTKTGAYLNVRATEYLTVFAGPSYSLNIYDKDKPDISTLPENYIFEPNYNDVYGNYFMTGWWGLNFGVKISFLNKLK